MQANDPYPSTRPARHKHQVTEDLLRSIADAVMTLDLSGNITFWNRGAEELFGWTAEEIVGCPATVLLPADRRDEIERVMRILAGAREQAAVETVRLHRDGSQLAISCRMAPVTDDDGRVYGASAVVRANERELALRRRLEQEQREARRRFTDSPLPQLSTDPQGRITAANGAVCRLLGWPSDKAMLGRSVLDLIPPEDVADAAALLAQFGKGSLDQSSHRRRLVHTGGHILDTAVTVFVIRGDDDEVERLEAVFHETPEAAATSHDLQQTEDKWRHLAQHATDVGLLCDADGHIKFVSSAITQQFGYGPEDVTGLDGFSFIHPDDEPGVRQYWREILTQPGARRTFQTRIRAANRQWRWVQNTLTNYLDVPSVQAVVVNMVDVTGHEAITPGVLERVNDLRRALLADEFVVHYQPVLSLTDGRMAGVEALVRWQHPDQGLITPAGFIDAAEASGLIVQLGEGVLTAACKAATRWAHLGDGQRPFHVAVNLSAQQLTRPDFVGFVETTLARTGASAENVSLEVTESAVMADVDAATATLQQLRRLGFRIAVDDFGTGYSSLTYVRRFPVTALKIDRSFVAGLGVDDDDAAIVASVISLARAVRLDCVAEGVESHAQNRALQALGCQYAQGFLWSPALEPDELEAWAAEHDPRAVLEAPAEPPVLSKPRGRTGARRPPLASPAVLGRMAALQAQGASLNTIAAALNGEGLLTQDGKRWHARTVAHALVRSVP